jgi:lipoate-protein ligase A
VESKEWRLILDGKLNGYYNMAVDEALIRHYPGRNIPTLRIYGWAKPFLSLGYNQQAGKVLEDLCPMPFVRRITGGSAILHGREITYSITCSQKDLALPKKVKDSYRMLCSFLKHFYSRLGLKAAFACEVLDEPLGGCGAFCFSSSQHFDLVIQGRKIGGNAQRRSQGVIFQHGSIPQELDVAGIQRSIKNTGSIRQKATCLNELLGRDTYFYSLSLLLSRSFQESFGVVFACQGLSGAERDTASVFLDKYRASGWNVHRREADSLKGKLMGSRALEPENAFSTMNANHVAKNI